MFVFSFAVPAGDCCGGIRPLAGAARHPLTAAVARKPHCLRERRKTRAKACDPAKNPPNLRPGPAHRAGWGENHASSPLQPQPALRHRFRARRRNHGGARLRAAGRPHRRVRRQLCRRRQCVPAGLRQPAGALAYSTGRFSGGSNYIDTLATLLGVPVENFAIGGAFGGTNNGTLCFDAGAPLRRAVFEVSTSSSTSARNRGLPPTRRHLTATTCSRSRSAATTRESINRPAVRWPARPPPETAAAAGTATSSTGWWRWATRRSASSQLNGAVAARGRAQPGGAGDPRRIFDRFFYVAAVDPGRLCRRRFDRPLSRRPVAAADVAADPARLRADQRRPVPGGASDQLRHQPRPLPTSICSTSTACT